MGQSWCSREDAEGRCGGHRHSGRSISRTGAARHRPALWHHVLRLSAGCRVRSTLPVSGAQPDACRSLYPIPPAASRGPASKICSKVLSGGIEHSFGVRAAGCHADDWPSAAGASPCAREGFLSPGVGDGSRGFVVAHALTKREPALSGADFRAVARHGIHLRRPWGPAGRRVRAPENLDWGLRGYAPSACMRPIVDLGAT
jgi:hypothetical protein